MWHLTCMFHRSRSKRFIYPLSKTAWLWSPSGYQRFFSQGWGMMLTTCLNLVQTLWMVELHFYSPCVPSWCRQGLLYGNWAWCWDCDVRSCPTPKKCNILRLLFWRSTLIIVMWVQFSPISSHESKITPYLSKMSYCTQNCYAVLFLAAVVWWKQVPWYCSHRWPYCTSSWWQVSMKHGGLIGKLVGENEVLGERLVPVSLWPPQIHNST